jgi:hypothetical protein
MEPVLNEHLASSMIAVLSFLCLLMVQSFLRNLRNLRNLRMSISCGFISAADNRLSYPANPGVAD